MVDFPSGGTRTARDVPARGEIVSGEFSAWRVMEKIFPERGRNAKVGTLGGATVANVETSEF